MVVGVLALTLPQLGGSVARADTPLPTVYVDGDPVAPPPKDQAGNLLKGTGLCGGFRLADTSDMAALARTLFPQRPADFPSSGVDTFQQALNDFMDGRSGIAGAPSDPQPHFATLLTVFDLASRATLPGINSTGDFRDRSECASNSSAGCKFPASGVNLDTTPLPAFVSRFRGFMLVPQGTEKIPMYIGFFTQDEVAMRIFQKPAQGQTNAKVYEVISRSPVGPTGAYRVTNTITFKNPGIYPIEILHASDQDPAVLEMVVQNSNPNFINIDGPVASTTSLETAGFSLEYTLPIQFFQTSSGALPFDGQPAMCQQCPRMYANQPGQPKGICPQGMFCNEAAVCSPCVGDQFCGNSCRMCMAPELYCVRDPASAGTDYTCVECREDPDCKPGQKCANGKCINPCPCCPDTPYCIVTDPLQPTARNCSQCRTNSDCGEDRQCDLLNGHCVDKLADCRTDDRCGSGCVDCDATTQGQRKHCMDGAVCVQCRYDVDCADKPGTYCRSGDCVPCTHDRHCGPSCRGCGIDINVAPDGTTVVSSTTEKPFCLAEKNEAASAVCVRCLNDAQCGVGGSCDLTTHQCRNTCSTPCENGTVCDGSRCVQCFTSAQCPCGQCINGMCTATCGDSTDCRSNQCCSQDKAQCIDGRCKPGLTAHGGGLCCNSTGGSIGLANDPVAPAPGHGPLWAMLAALGLLTLGRTSSLRAARARQGLGPQPAAPSGTSGSRN